MTSDSSAFSVILSYGESSAIIDYIPNHPLSQMTMSTIVDAFQKVLSFDTSKPVTKSVENAYMVIQNIPLFDCSRNVQLAMNTISNQILQKGRRMKENSRKTPIIQAVLLPMMYTLCQTKQQKQGEEQIQLFWRTQKQSLTKPELVISFLVNQLQEFNSHLQGFQETNDLSIRDYMKSKCDKVTYNGFCKMYEFLTTLLVPERGTVVDFEPYFEDTQVAHKVIAAISKRVTLLLKLLENESNK